MLQKLSYVAIVAIILLSFSQIAFAQNQITQDITAIANVYNALTVDGVNTVDFSNINVNCNPVINPTGGGLTTAFVGASKSQGGFTVHGSASATIKVSWTAQGVLADGSGHSMKFTAYLTTSSAPFTSGSNATLTSGSCAFLVGGTLYAAAGSGVVPQSQATGSYSTANTSDGGAPVTFTIDYVL